MSRPFDQERFFANPEALAAVVAADAVFGLWRRSLDLPGTFLALVWNTRGEARLCPAQTAVDGREARELLLVRAQPVEVAAQVQDLPAADKYLCNVEARLLLSVVAERRELESFRERVLGSAAQVNVEALGRYLRPAVEAALQAHVRQYPVAELVDGRHESAGSDAVAQALAEPCFAAGLSLAAAPLLQIQSPAYARVRQTEERAAVHLSEHAAARAVQETLQATQRNKLEHLSGLLDRLRQMGEAAPGTTLPELMRVFSEAERGQLYAALLHNQAPPPNTRWIAVASGTELLFFDPADPSKAVRTLDLDGPAGALRSLQLAERSPGAAPVLLIGAARGVLVLPAESSAPAETYLFEAGEVVRGGVNAVAARGADLVASHTECGLIRWQRNQPQPCGALLAEHTRGARAVRAVQFSGTRMWCAVNEQIFSVPAADLAARPTVLSGSRGLISALAVDQRRVFAGNAEGEVLMWPNPDSDSSVLPQPGNPPEILHAGGRQPAETVALVNLAALEQLIYTDLSTAVHARVLGDTFACRYESDGQTIRRAEVAPDLLVGTTENRDRLVVWSTARPEQPRAVIRVAQMTGRSVQDVCLVPMSA